MKFIFKSKSKKRKIGKWNGYDVVYHGNNRWTIEKNGKIENEFDSKESFGHWVYHSGWKSK